MSAETFRQACEWLSLAAVALSFAVTAVRVVIGPSLPDRILALDMLVTTAIGFIAVLGLKTGFLLYLDLAIALGLVGFLSTVALARFVLTRTSTSGEQS